VQVVWTRGALRQLTAIGAYISEDSPDVALSVVQRIFASADLLADFPQFGAPTDRPNTRTYKVPRLPYRVFYRVRPRLDRIEVLRVAHGRRLR
jgi:toxin ParE1/3/4